MSEKLYDLDPYLARCEANILSCRKISEGWAAVLDRTVFFARGGGQPCEGGTISGVRVLDVYEQDGEVLHILEREVPLGPAEPVIDIGQRVDHMCQHLGEHILSAVIERLYGEKISILRIEPESSHIEIGHELSPEQLFDAECETNRIIAQNLPVSTFFISPEEAAKRLPADKVASHEHVRIVEIPGVDFNGCGGTHCRSTGEVGQLLICGTKLVRGAFRIYFKCGARAENENRERLLAIIRLERSFDAELLPEALEKALATLERKNALEQQNRALRELLLSSDSALWALEAEPVHDGIFLCRIYEGDAKHAKAVCDAVTGSRKAALLVAVPANGQLSLIFCRSKAKDGPDLGRHLSELAAQNGGKGGGSVIAAQGMIPDSAEARAKFFEVCKHVKSELV